ncbi:Uncharacterised protein [Alysiella crassa]|uniref:Lipoprotein n=2 Tax=Alysiella crassa TaxID=153491 RepID=A0A376BKX8_9NEIS|nr:Uncharacterised protein [Alysiella crassa]
MKIARKWLSGCLTILLAAACQPSITQTKMASSPSPAQRVQAACKNLHKVVDIDDLLKQMYDNLDSQCLFEMPQEMLIQIWGIPVIDSMKEEVELNKQLENEIFNEKNTLYIYRTSNIKEINGKVEKFASLHVYTSPKFKQVNLSFGGSLDKGQYPNILPPPFIKQLSLEEINEDGFLTSFIENEKERSELQAKLPKQNIYQPNTRYYWINPKKLPNYPILYMETLPLSPFNLSNSTFPNTIELIQYAYILNH